MNSAKTGGVLLADCEYFFECKVNISNTILEGNFAEIAPTVMSKCKNTFLNDSSLINNYDSADFAKNKISAYPLKIFFLGDLIIRNGVYERVSIQGLIKIGFDKFLWLMPMIICHLQLPK